MHGKFNKLHLPQQASETLNIGVFRTGQILQNGYDVYLSLIEKVPDLTYLMNTDLPTVIFNRPVTITLAANLIRKVSKHHSLTWK